MSIIEITNWKAILRSKKTWALAALLVVNFSVMGYLVSKNHSSTSKTEEKSNQKREVYSCPMHPSVTSDHPDKCPICQMDLQKVEGGSEGGTASGEQKPTGERKILFYRNPMRADITSKTPAKDDMGMDYIPVYEDDVNQSGSSQVEGRGSFSLPLDRQKLIGVTSTKVERRHLNSEIRASGRVAFDPELFSAAEEYRQALLSRSQMNEGSYPALREQTNELIASAKTKLKLMGLGEEQIRALGRGGSSMNLLLPSGTVWVYAEIFEYEAGGLKSGAAIEAEAPSIPGKTFLGKVSSISPVVNSPTRTVRLRALVPDPGGVLRPDTFLNVKIKTDLGERLVVPEDSVLNSGQQAFVFVIKGQGQFEPRAIRIGLRTQDYYEVLSGVNEGDVVVTGANFLIDSESKLRGVLQSMKSSSAPSEDSMREHK